MGSSLSITPQDINLYENIYTTHKAIGKHQYEFSSLNLSEEDIGKLYTKFIALDANHDGSIDSKEFFHHFSISKSRFASRVFNFYDIDDSGKVDFHKFVLVSWNFCTIDKKNIDRFIYELYDKEKTRELPYSEIALITKEIYGREFKKNQNLQKALTALQPQLHTTMTPDSWIAFCLRHPYLLYPVILFQNELRTALFGVSFWEGQTTYRSDLCDQQYLPFGKFLHDLLSGKLDPRYEKRRMRNKSATIIMNPTQNQYFSNRKGVHSFDDQQDQEEADVKTHVHPSRRASRSPAAASGTSTSGSKTPTSVSMTASVSEVTNGGGRSSSPSSAGKFFTFHPNSFLSLLSVRSSSSPAPAATTAAASSRTAQQPSEQSATRISSPVRFVHFAPFPTTIHSGSGSDSPNKFDLPPLERLPSDILKERRRQELIYHKSIKQQARFGRASSKSSYRTASPSVSSFRSEGLELEVEESFSSHLSHKKSKRRNNH